MRIPFGPLRILFVILFGILLGIPFRILQGFLYTFLRIPFWIPVCFLYDYLKISLLASLGIPSGFLYDYCGILVGFLLVSSRISSGSLLDCIFGFPQDFLLDSCRIP